MCGIFGYIGKNNNASQITLEGLKLLEYRGYDSWGIAAKPNPKSKIQNPKFIIKKHVGKIGNASLKSFIINHKSSIAVGHTRWATHGGVTVKNAHPHLDCTKTLAVVHNGIVENFQELKDDLSKRGHKFISETDTEVIVHLIEDFLKKKGFASSVRDAFNSLKGLNAIVVASSKSSEIIAAKNGSPLIIGIGRDGLYIASDASGILKHTKKVIFLEDNQMAILGKAVKLVKLPKGDRLRPHIKTLSFGFKEANIGKYEHFMVKEIYEQPDVIKNIAQNYTDQIRNLADLVKMAKGTFFIGAGTAFHASLAGAYIFSKIAHKHVNTSVASEFNYLEDFLTKDSLIIALSQSGETIDVVEPLNRAKKKKSKIVAITNSIGSTIYRIADYNVLLNAGVEKAVASTKAYIAKLAIILMLVLFLTEKAKEARTVLLKTAGEIERILSKKNVEKIKQIAKILYKSKNIYIIGRGISYPSALEAALKIKEVSYIPAEGLAGGELKHGTIALIEKGTPCIVFAPKDETYESVISNAIEIKSRGGLIIGISSQNLPVFDYFVEVKDTKEATFISQIIPSQILAYYLAVEKGYDPDKPRNLAKSVTVK